MRGVTEKTWVARGGQEDRIGESKTWLYLIRRLNRSHSIAEFIRCSTSLGWCPTGRTNGRFSALAEYVDAFQKRFNGKQLLNEPSLTTEKLTGHVNTCVERSQDDGIT